MTAVCRRLGTGARLAARGGVGALLHGDSSKLFGWLFLLVHLPSVSPPPAAPHTHTSTTDGIVDVGWLRGASGGPDVWGVLLANCVQINLVLNVTLWLKVHRLSSQGNTFVCETVLTLTTKTCSRLQSVSSKLSLLIVINKGQDSHSLQEQHPISSLSTVHFDFPQLILQKWQKQFYTNQQP